MDDENPYRSPGVSTPPSASAKFEQLISTRLLLMRERGYSLSLFYRWSWPRLLLSLIYFGAVMAFLARLGYWHACFLMLGLLLGMLSRDFAWARLQVRSWPIQERLLDWDKVQSMADGETVA